MGNSIRPSKDIEFIKKYQTLDINKNSTSKLKLLTQLKKEKILLKDVSISRIPSKDTTQISKLFSSGLDFSELSNLSFVYCEDLNKLEIQTQKFPELKKLSLIGDRIQDTNFLNAFKNCKKLETIDLRGNYWNKFPSIKEFKFLTRLNLQCLNLDEIPIEVNQLNRLKYLNFAENKISKFSDAHISNLKQLDTIFCFKNNIKELPSKFPTSLRILDFSNNNVTEFPDFSNCSLLIEISGRFNRISKMQTGKEGKGEDKKEVETENDIILLNNLPELGRLYLANNQIKKISIQRSKSLFSIDLTNNKIEEIIGIKDILAQVEEVYLGGNLLGDKFLQKLIPTKSKKELSKLRKLFIGYNRIQNIPQEILENPNIFWLDFSGNIIEKLPEIEVTEAFKANRRLSFISFNNLKMIPKVFFKYDIQAGFRTAICGNSIKDCELKTISDFMERNKIVQEIKIADFEKRKNCFTGKKLYEFVSYGTFETKGPYRMSNEDKTCLCSIANDFELYFVADGHGGKDSSSFTSKKFPKILEKHLLDVFDGDGNEETQKKQIEKSIIISIKDLEEEMKDQNIRDGCCFIGLLIYNHILCAINIGDSRMICCKANQREIKQLTIDHTPKTEFDRLKKRNDIVINQRVNGIVACSRALGDFGILVSTPDIFFYDLNILKPKTIIIGCDGLFDMIRNERLFEVYHHYKNQESDLFTMASYLVNYAISSNSRDNISCCILEFDHKKM